MSSSPNYIRWDAPGVEQEQPNEQHDIKEIAGQFCRFQVHSSSGAWMTLIAQKMNLNEHGHCYRGSVVAPACTIPETISTHVKTQGVVIGKLTVNEGLPEHLAQGMFKRPGTYDCAMRYSSLTPKHLPDTVPAPRGIGLCVDEQRHHRRLQLYPVGTAERLRSRWVGSGCYQSWYWWI